jgi:hypothetical protein
MDDAEEGLKRRVLHAVRMQIDVLNDVVRLLRYTLLNVGCATGVITVHVPEEEREVFVRDFGDVSGPVTLQNGTSGVRSTIHVLWEPSGNPAMFEFRTGTFLAFPNAGALLRVGLRSMLSSGEVLDVSGLSTTAWELTDSALGASYRVPSEDLVTVLEASLTRRGASTCGTFWGQCARIVGWIVDDVSDGAIAMGLILLADRCQVLHHAIDALMTESSPRDEDFQRIADVVAQLDGVASGPGLGRFAEIRDQVDRQRKPQAALALEVLRLQLETVGTAEGVPSLRAALLLLGSAETVGIASKRLGNVMAWRESEYWMKYPEVDAERALSEIVRFVANVRERTGLTIFEELVARMSSALTEVSSVQNAAKALCEGRPSSSPPEAASILPLLTRVRVLAADLGSMSTEWPGSRYDAAAAQVKASNEMKSKRDELMQTFAAAFPSPTDPLRWEVESDDGLDGRIAVLNLSLARPAEEYPALATQVMTTAEPGSRGLVHSVTRAMAFAGEVPGRHEGERLAFDCLPLADAAGLARLVDAQGAAPGRVGLTNSGNHGGEKGASGETSAKETITIDEATCLTLARGASAGGKRKSLVVSHQCGVDIVFRRLPQTELDGLGTAFLALAGGRHETWATAVRLGTGFGAAAGSHGPMSGALALDRVMQFNGRLRVRDVPEHLGMSIVASVRGGALSCDAEIREFRCGPGARFVSRDDFFGRGWEHPFEMSSDFVVSGDGMSLASLTAVFECSSVIKVASRVAHPVILGRGTGSSRADAPVLVAREPPAAANVVALFMRLARKLAIDANMASEIARERWCSASNGYAPGVIDPYPRSKERLNELKVGRDLQMAFGALADDQVTYRGKEREAADAALLALLPDAAADTL